MNEIHGHHAENSMKEKLWKGKKKGEGAKKSAVVSAAVLTTTGEEI
jgi:hypothetical protein